MGAKEAIHRLTLGSPLDLSGQCQLKPNTGSFLRKNRETHSGAHRDVNHPSLWLSSKRQGFQ